LSWCEQYPVVQIYCRLDEILGWRHSSHKFNFQGEAHDAFAICFANIRYILVIRNLKTEEQWGFTILNPFGPEKEIRYAFDAPSTRENPKLFQERLAHLSHRLLCPERVKRFPIINVHHLLTKTPQKLLLLRINTCIYEIRSIEGQNGFTIQKRGEAKQLGMIQQEQGGYTITLNGVACEMLSKQALEYLEYFAIPLSHVQDKVKTIQKRFVVDLESTSASTHREENGPRISWGIPGLTTAEQIHACLLSFVATR